MNRRCASPLLLLLAACATPAALPDDVPRGEPRVSAARAPLPAKPGEVDVLEVPYPRLSERRAKDVLRFVRAALPAEAWTPLTGLEPYAQRIAVAQTPAMRERARDVIRAIRSAARRRVGALVEICELPWATVDSLGILRQAPGAGDASPFLVAPLSRGAIRHVQNLLVDGKARRLWEGETTGLPAQFLRLRNERKQAYLAGVEVRSDPRVERIVAPHVAVSEAGTALEVAVVPTAEGMLLAYDVRDVVVVFKDGLTARVEPFTHIPASLPTRVIRRGSDVALLGPHEGLALIGTSADADLARVILIRPGLHPTHVPWELDLYMTPQDPRPVELEPGMPGRIAPAER